MTAFSAPTVGVVLEFVGVLCFAFACLDFADYCWNFIEIYLHFKLTYISACTFKSPNTIVGFAAIANDWLKR